MEMPSMVGYRYFLELPNPTSYLLQDMRKIRPCPHVHVFGYVLKPRFFPFVFEKSASTHCVFKSHLPIYPCTFWSIANLWRYCIKKPPFCLPTRIREAGIIFKKYPVFENLCFRWPKTPVMCGRKMTKKAKFSVFNNVWIRVDGAKICYWIHFIIVSFMGRCFRIS